MSIKKACEINSKKLTFQYCLLMGGYWATFCPVFTFAAVLLSSRGFSDSQVGIIIAVGNILGVILQPVFGTIADASKKISLHLLTAVLSIAAAVLYALLLVIPNLLLAIAFLFVITDALLQVIQPLTNSVSVYYVNRGVSCDFGVSRAIGSLTAAVLSSAVGNLVASKGENSLIICGAFFFLFMAAVLLVMPRVSETLMKSQAGDAKYEAGNEPDSGLANSSEAGGISRIINKYPSFCVVLVGVAFLFTFHNMTNNYMLRIVSRLGGDSSHMGNALAIAAAVEVPMMIFFSRLIKKVSGHVLILISGIMFFLKAVFYLLAPSIPWFYASQVFQMFSYAIYIPASVYYVNGIMEDCDKFKGQAIMTGSNSLGGVLGSLLGGVLLESFGTVPMMISGAVIAFVGTGFIGLSFLIGSKKQDEK